jgi:hypothetical protein|tara:strand:+ start:5577 stop:6446 length:870 start_codon:yes stop_codon:yes gene_type:complete
MSETEMIEEERESNPYNMKKPWHKADGKRMPQADELYYDDEVPKPEKATRQKRKSAPEEDTSTTNHNYKKRYDDLKKHYDQKMGEFKQRELDLQTQMQESQPKYEAPKSQEELQEFREANPDLYETVESVAHNIASEQVENLQPRLSAIEQRERELAMREAEQAMKQNHPDYDDIRGSDDFHTWAEDQPDQIQDWIYRNPDNVQLASKAIDLYKMESGKGQSSPKRRSNSAPQSEISAADMVSTKTTNVEPQQAKIWTETEIAKMSLDQFDKHEEEIRQAIDEGRVRKG